MKLELQVNQPATGKLLKSLGIRLKADNYWRFFPNLKGWKLFQGNIITMNATDSVPAYSIADLGNMIPWGFLQKVVVHKMPGGFWQCELSDKKMHSFPLEVEARAFYLIDLIRSGQVKVDEINHPELYNAFLPGGKRYPVKSEK